MVQQNDTTKLEVNKVKIGFTLKEITAYGGYSLLAKFFDKIGLRRGIENIIPFSETSPNRLEIYSKIIAFILIVFSGGERFSHLLYLGSRNVLEKMFGIQRLPLAGTTLSRFFNKIDKMSLVEKMTEKMWDYVQRLIPWGNIQEDWLTFDSTVIVRYGNQEGAKKGYNPNKKGRPSHNPLIAFLNRSKYVVHFWNRSGDVISRNNIYNFFSQTITRIQERIKVLGVIADSGFYERKFIEMLENANRIYIIAVILYHSLQQKIYSLDNWRSVGAGIDIAEFYFQHQGWEKVRRYIVIRQDTGIRQKATGKQMKLFEEEVKQYRYSVWVSNSKDDAYTVWNFCKVRANDENTIKELKGDFALGGFCMKKFYATEGAMLVRVFVYNLFVLFRNLVMEQKEKTERLKTLRYKYFVIPSQLGKRGSRFILRLSIRNEKIKQKFIRLFSNINQYFSTDVINCNAVGKI